LIPLLRLKRQTNFAYQPLLEMVDLDLWCLEIPIQTVECMTYNDCAL